MLKSKVIADFVPADFERIRAGVPIPGDLHLYFKSNAHVMLWQPAGSILTQQMIDKYKRRGVVQIWVHRSDWEPFAKFLNHGIVLEAPPDVQLAPPPAELIYQTKVSAQDFGAILSDGDKSEREKRALAAKHSRTLLGELAAPANLEEQDIVRRAVSQVVRELVNTEGAASEDFRSEDTKKACRQIWGVATRDPEHCHGINVSTTAVLFTLAFGMIDGNALAEVALAGLIHDIALTFLPYQLTQSNRMSIANEQKSGQKHEYLRHGDALPRLLAAFAPEIPDRVAQIAQHHHDNYSPDAMSPASDLAQLIGIADQLDSICSGQWDGKERTFVEGLNWLEESENAAAAANIRPRFNPVVLSAVFRWIRGSIPEDVLATASLVVGEQARAVQS